MMAVARRKSRGPMIVLGVLVMLTVVAIVAAGSLWANIQSKLDRVETIESAFPAETSRPAPKEPAEGAPPINVLLLGSDSEEDPSGSMLDDLGNRADTIIVAHIPGDRSSIHFISIMRDSWVTVPNHGHMKINGALAVGGVPLMVQTVESIIDQRIDHVVMIDIQGFQGATEALGGVTLYNPNEFTVVFTPEASIHFPAGPITLNGEEALIFVRERYAFPDGDYQRVKNQQIFMGAMISQVLTRDTLTSPEKLNDLIESVTPYLAMTPGLDVPTLVGIAQTMVDVRGREIEFFTVPTLGTGNEGGQSVVYLDWDAVDRLQEAFATDNVAGFRP